jgi:hypothetical protein
MCDIHRDKNIINSNYRATYNFNWFLLCRTVRRRSGVEMNRRHAIN